MKLEISDSLEKYLRIQSGILTIGNFYEVVGWWKAFLTTSGRMCSPDNLVENVNVDAFEIFSVKGYKIFIQKELLTEKIIQFRIQGEGNFEIQLMWEEKNNKQGDLTWKYWSYVPATPAAVKWQKDF